MKKILAIIAAGAVLAAAATAEITFSTWLRVQEVVADSDGDEMYTGSVNSWGGARYARLNIAGQDEDGRVGFKMDIYDEDGEISRGDNAYLWVRPIEQIKISAGKWDSSENWLRENLCYGQWNWLRTYNYITDDEGLTFTGAYAGLFHIQIYPIDGLQVYIGIPIPSNDLNQNDEDLYYTNSNATWGNVADGDALKATYISTQVAIAYNISPISSVIKAQWIGHYDDQSTDNDGDFEDGMDYGSIEVAFDFGMVQNLWVTAGFRYNLTDGDLLGSGSATTWMPGYDCETMKITLGLSYSLGDLIGWEQGLTIFASGGVRLYNSWDYGDAEKDPMFSFGVGINLGLVEDLRLEADVRYMSTESGKKEDGSEYDYENDCVSFLVGVVYNIGSNGEIGIGFQGASNGCGFLGSELRYEDKFAWAVPIRLGVWL